MTYYNEHDPKAAAWLRELISDGLIPAGDVDERSICDVRPHELTGYTQQHFFAGIGGWPYALRLAGWPDDRPVRSGSAPCQPFSGAGKGLGEKDPRHLWPVFRDLITFGEATVTFGEQVAGAAGRVWLSRVRADLEGLGYGVGGADLCSAGVGSPNIRQRLFWMAHATGSRCDRRAQSGATGRAQGEGNREDRKISGRIESARNSPTCRVGHAGCCRDESVGQRGDTPCAPTETQGQERQQRSGDAARDADPGSVRLGDAELPRLERQPGNVANGREPGRDDTSAARPASAPGRAGFWSACDILPCTDGKSRRIEPGSFPLVARLPGELGRGGDQSLPFDPQACAEGRVMRLRGYGNSINPWLAAEFILACEEAR